MMKRPWAAFFMSGIWVLSRRGPSLTLPCEAREGAKSYPRALRYGVMRHSA